MSRNYLVAGAFLIIGIIALPVLQYTRHGSRDLVPGFFLPILALVLLLFLMQARHRAMKEQGTRVAGLQEYQEQKTIGGMPARPVPPGRVL